MSDFNTPTPTNAATTLVVSLENFDENLLQFGPLEQVSWTTVKRVVTPTYAGNSNFLLQIGYDDNTKNLRSYGGLRTYNSALNKFTPVTADEKVKGKGTFQLDVVLREGCELSTLVQEVVGKIERKFASHLSKIIDNPPPIEFLNKFMHSPVHPSNPPYNPTLQLKVPFVKYTSNQFPSKPGCLKIDSIIQKGTTFQSQTPVTKTEDILKILSGGVDAVFLVRLLPITVTVKTAASSVGLQVYKMLVTNQLNSDDGASKDVAFVSRGSETTERVAGHKRVLEINA